MKYMGSKRAMLRNGLGETISREIIGRKRFADLFTGSGAVACHVARNFNIPVVATDLQRFSVDLASSVVCRDRRTASDWIALWIEQACRRVNAHEKEKEARELQQQLNANTVSSLAKKTRELCVDGQGPVFAAYGGYYFSALQAIYLDAFRATIPLDVEQRSIAMAALIQAASRCSASPGHTAQPFKPNSTAGRFLIEAWDRDILQHVLAAATALLQDHAKVAGFAAQSDATDAAYCLNEGDLAFVDPPYSGVHYSRFYHVLETLAQGTRVHVSGTGRYPPPSQRARSEFSVPTTAEDAFDDLMEALANAGCSVIVTFPAGLASNGLDGETVQEIAEQYFRIKSAKVTSRFSTLGGNLTNREARQDADELILTLHP